MTALLIIIFLVTIIYLSIGVSMKTYINLIGLQGLLLFGISVLELHEINATHFIFILIETLVFKAFVVPYILYKVSKRNRITNLRNNKARRINKGFNLIITSILVMGGSFILAYDLHDNHLNIKYFTAALSAIIMGIIYIIINRNILTHLISFLVIENGIFLLALAVGGEMPMLVNSAILLDVFASVLILGVFFNRIGEHFQHTDADQLTELKD